MSLIFKSWMPTNKLIFWGIKITITINGKLWLNQLITHYELYKHFKITVRNVLQNLRGRVYLKILLIFIFINIRQISKSKILICREIIILLGKFHTEYEYSKFFTYRSNSPDRNTTSSWSYCTSRTKRTNHKLPLRDLVG